MLIVRVKYFIRTAQGRYSHKESTLIIPVKDVGTNKDYISTSQGRFLYKKGHYLYMSKMMLQMMFFGHVKDILTIPHVRDVI